MAFVFNFPDVGEGIHEGRVVEWLVAEGDAIAEDQLLSSCRHPAPAPCSGCTSRPTPPFSSATRW
jgi:hypothetical protein